MTLGEKAEDGKPGTDGSLDVKGKDGSAVQLAERWLNRSSG